MIAYHVAPTAVRGSSPGLMGLVERYDAVACDLSSTEAIGSVWLRWMQRMSVTAERMGKRVALVALGDPVRETADVLGLEGQLLLVSTIEEAWGS